VSETKNYKFTTLELLDRYVTSKSSYGKIYEKHSKKNDDVMEQASELGEEPEGDFLAYLDEARDKEIMGHQILEDKIHSCLFLLISQISILCPSLEPH
jgi:DNA-binding ferritin-like protein